MAQKDAAEKKGENDHDEDHDPKCGP